MSIISKITGLINPIEKVLNIVDKAVLDKDKKEEIKLELVKLEFEKYKEEKTIIEKVLDFIFPSLVIPLVLGFIINAVRSGFGYEALFTPDQYNVQLVETLMYLVLGKKTVDKAGKVYEKTHNKKE